MLNFAVGPVEEFGETLVIGGERTPYFRTEEFSEVMLESERLVLEFAGAPTGARAVFLTGSGTAGMEAVVLNVLREADRALVVNGGSFGSRFRKICEIHGIPHDEVKLEAGRQVREADLAPFDGKGCSVLLVNKHETSTGVLYDMDLLSDFCRRNGMLLIVDNISSFLADEFDMAALGADAMIAGSQKALACAPGVCVVVLGPRALARVERNRQRTFYLDFKAALADGARGQTPFTPAVGTLRQIHARLKSIAVAGGAASEVARTRALAEDFRQRIRGLPLAVASDSPSNAATPLHPTNGQSAYGIFVELKDRHGIWVCPNGGTLRDRIFRVGHMGALTTADNAALAAALAAVLEGGGTGSAAGASSARIAKP
ncbi:MAG: alanine--glyoxylate aminotransferase family protein [Kiritimatiellae bacterium]|nr:alanine--glyoxylate aminotransferase family protein [Kiritimatiellia bacterium]